jgi:hypothetical protein
MKLTSRDIKLIRDMALAQVLSRDQILKLKYFSSVTRLNSRLRELIAEGLVKRHETPYFTQSLYFAAPKAAEIVGENIAKLLRSRLGSPRLIRHSLAVTEARLNLVKRGASVFRFEQQLWCKFAVAGKVFEVRPDGLAIHKDNIAVLELDLGHTGLPKLAVKLRAYEAFIASGECKRRWQCDSFTLLMLTPGPERKRHLAQLQPPSASFCLRVETLSDFGITVPGLWS